MINQKLDLVNIIETMNELEKLKMLLFDENQYYIFEHIPKPILFDKKIIELNEKDVEEIEKDLGAKRETMDLNLDGDGKKKKKRTNTILTCNGRFW